MKPLIYRATCKTCGRPRADDEQFSWSGQCQPCALHRLAENHLAMRSRSGPAWLRWRRSMAASVGGTLLDDQGRGE